MLKDIKAVIFDMDGTLIDSMWMWRDIDIEYLGKHNKRNQVIFIFGINTGLRISDILALDVGDVRGKTHIEIREKKTSKFKKFPINSKLKIILKDFISGREDSEPLFMSNRYNRLDRSQVYRMLNNACRSIGLDINVGTHTMRKSFGFHHYQQNHDVAMLQTIFNHSSPSITMRYIGINQDEIDKSYLNFIL